MTAYLLGLLSGLFVAALTFRHLTRKVLPRLIQRLMATQADVVRNETEIEFLQAMDVAVNAAILQSQITGKEMGAGMFQVLVREAMARNDELRQESSK